MVSIDLAQAVNENTDSQIWSKGAFYSIVSNLGSSFGQRSFCLTKLELNDIKSKVMSYLHSFIQATTMSSKDHNTSTAILGVMV